MSIPELIAAALALGSLGYVLAPLIPRRGAEASPQTVGSCAACGAALPPDARFCANCGHPLVGRAE